MKLSERYDDCGCTYTSSGLWGVKPALAIHADARDSEEEIKSTGRVPAFPPGARGGGPSNVNGGVGKLRGGGAKRSRVLKEEGYCEC